MNLLKKIFLILFCGLFFAVRTKMAREIQHQVDSKSFQQTGVWDGANASRGEFVKR